MRTSIFLVLIIIISKLTGFLRDTSIAYVYGVSDSIDAYFVGQTVPMLIFGIIAAGLATTLLPLFIREEKEKGVEATQRFLNVVISNFGIIVLVLIGIGILASGQIVKIVAPEYSGEKYAMSVMLSMIGFPSILFSTLGAICTAKLQSMNKFIGPALIGIAANAVLISYLYIFSNHFGIYGFMVATVISYMTEIMVMMPILAKSGWRFKFTVDFRHPLFKKMLLLMFPILIGTAVDQINVLVDRILSSGLPEGNLSSLNYAYRLNALITSLFASSVGAVIYYATSQSTAEKDYNKLQKQLYGGLELIVIIGLPMAFGIFSFAKPIVQMIFERGNFSEYGSNLTSYALMFYSIGIMGVMVRDLLSRTFYSLQDTKTPMFNGFFAVGLNIVLSLILVNYMGIGGLALAAGLSLSFSGLSLYMRMHRKIKIAFHKKILWSMGKGLIASFVMIFAAQYVYQELLGKGAPSATWQIVSLLVAILLAAVLYAVIISFMKFDITEAMIGNIKNKLNKKKSRQSG